MTGHHRQCHETEADRAASMACNFRHITELSGKMVFVLYPLLPSAAAPQLCITMAKLGSAYSLVSIASLTH